MSEFPAPPPAWTWLLALPLAGARQIELHLIKHGSADNLEVFLL